MDSFNWAEELHECAVTVSNIDKVVVYQNRRSIETFGNAVGQNLDGCHHLASSREKIAAMLADGSTNSYTIEKHGVHKMIYQTPWYEGGELRGLVEFSIVVPAAMPHFVR